MNNAPHQSPPTRADTTGRRYWRSLGELQDTPGFRAYLEREFPEGATELNEVDRRHFMKIMAASFALGGFAVTGCRRPEARILAYSKTPEHTIPGLPLYFASAFPLRKSALPIVVETHSGRPTKIEGNPSYSAAGGATSLLAQASVLDLYDPDRSVAHRNGDAPASVAEVNELLAGILPRFRSNRGDGLAFLAGHSSSPTRLRLARTLKRRLPRAIWAEFEPVDQSAGERATTALLGRPAKAHYDYARARRVLSVDADFLGAEEGSTEYSRAFASGRRVESVDDSMSRLYAVESSLTLTGGMADHRLRLAAGQMTAFLAQLALELGIAGPAGLESLAASAPASAEWIAACAADLREHQGESLVVAGGQLPEAAHAIALLINRTLGNLGRTVSLLAVEASEAATIGELAAGIRDGAVQTLVILGGNPAYNAPVDLDWKAAQDSVGEVIRLGYHDDETSEGVAWHISESHYLESWGDARTIDGTTVPVQPMIEPLFGGLTEIELLARILGAETPGAYEQVVATFARRVPTGTDAAFRKFLHDGLLENSGYPLATGDWDAAAVDRLLGAAPAAVTPGSDNLEVRFAADHKVDDGRFNNNGWLQECPDPITKLTWDNAILVGPRLASELGIIAPDLNFQIIRKNPNVFETGREIAPWARVTLNGRSIEGPVHIVPGMANYTIQLPLGYGRTRTGRVGEGAGFNAYALMDSTSGAVAQGATIEIIPKRTAALANTQEHWSMEGRAIVREANLEDFHAHPDFVQEVGMESHSPPVYGKDAGMSRADKALTSPRGNSLYEHPNLDGTTRTGLDGVHQWGMSIDLNTCTGCNACVVACQAENNIPIVGRDQVRRGREMHWIRLDRYFSDGHAEASPMGGPGNAIVPEDPQVSVQPVACFQCETAPCETVCPVNATVHDDEGLNVMAYNRCVGTRYCANNCPYKVRRFNFFDFNQRQLDKLYLGPLAEKGMPELLQMVQNPDVTVRMRGVMEKCTYCIQRIQQAKIERKVEARDSGDVAVPDGTFKVACQQVCPTEAIVFGNILDPESAVSRAKNSSRDYSLLGYLNTRPRTTYLARLRNPNPAMPDFGDISVPKSRQEYDARNPHGDHGAENGHGGGEHGATDAEHGAAADAAVEREGRH